MYPSGYCICGDTPLSSDLPALSPRPGALGRAAAWLLRALRLATPTPHVAGADYAVGYAANPTYSPDAALSTLSEFGWVYACVQAKAEDLAALPLIAVVGQGRAARRIDHHPALELLERPSSHIEGVALREQLIVDRLLSGDAYALILGEGEPEALLRLPPQRTRVVPWPDGQPGGYEYDNSRGRLLYPWESVLHVKGLSWEQDTRGLYGTGAIQPLRRDLAADMAASEHTRRTAAVGRPNGIFTPENGDLPIGPPLLAKLRKEYEDQFAGRDGAMFLSAGLKYQATGISPRDMEYQALRAYTRETILAVLDVPPVRVGLQDANYATANAQLEKYWRGLVGLSKRYDAAYTRLARLFPGSEQVRIEHDFSGVPVLQATRDAQLGRVKVWTDLGLSLQAACEIEGISLPAGAVVGAAPMRPDLDEAERVAGLRSVIHFPGVDP